MRERIGKLLGRPCDGLTYIWIVTIATIVALCFAAAGAVLFTGK